MRSYSHPNVMPLLASFVEGNELWMIMPHAAHGSVRSVLLQEHPKVCWGPSV